MKVTDKQADVLRAMKALFGARMEARPGNYRRLSNKLGWPNESYVRECLFALREKGFLVSEGSLQSQPDAWVIAFAATPAQ